MNKKYLVVWSLWIGFASGIFCIIYANTPIVRENIMWIAFVALPIFFGSGAKIQEFPHFFSSALAGIAWGVIMLQLIGKLVGFGLNGPLAMFYVVTLCTFCSVYLHMVILENTWFGKVPMIFGGLAMTFATGGTNLFSVIITMTCGLLLGLAISEGGKKISKMKFVGNTMETFEKED